MSRRRLQAGERSKRQISEHYGLVLHEGDGIMLRLPMLSEIDRDIAWARQRGFHWTYWPDGTKTLDFPKGRVRMPSPLVQR